MLESKERSLKDFFTHVPFLIRLRANNGSRTGSTDSPMFSINTAFPLFNAWKIIQFQFNRNIRKYR